MATVRTDKEGEKEEDKEGGMTTNSLGSIRQIKATIFLYTHLIIQIYVRVCVCLFFFYLITPKGDSQAAHFLACSGLTSVQIVQAFSLVASYRPDEV